MIKRILLAVLLFSSINALADGILISWNASNLEGMTKDRFNEAQKWKPGMIISKNLTVTDWPETYLLLVAGMQRKGDKELIKGLIEQLTDKTTVKLQFTNRLIIWERITSGDILFEGKGMQIDDDLFSVAGRANFLLRNITGFNFGLVGIHTTATELAALKAKWSDYAMGKFVEQYVNPFETDEEGLSEIRSLVAFEAMVVSLKSSKVKDSLTKACLAKMYGLDELPKEKNNPAMYCSPDTYTFTYLSALLGQKHDEQRNYEWWTKWWADNKSKLIWNKEKGHFEIK